MSSINTELQTKSESNGHLSDEPLGQKTNAIRWLQKQVMHKSAALQREFPTQQGWETFRARMRADLRRVIGMPDFAPLGDSLIRATLDVGDDVVLERVDVHVDEDYAIPSFVFRPKAPLAQPMPAVVWNPGWPEDKWKPAYQAFAVRMARQGYVVLIPDHAPFGETSDFENKADRGMTLFMGMGDVIGISQLAMRAAETMRCGEYLRSRTDINPARVAVAGLCQGGQDTWLSAALDDGFCAAAPICSATTFTIHMTEMASYMANSDSSPFPFGILNVCDVEHLHGAIAPRPLLVRANLPDEWWPVSGFTQVETFTRDIYRLYDAEDRIDFRAEVHEHNLTGPFADALEQFLLRHV